MADSKPSYRVYMSTVDEGRLVGVMMRRFDRMFDDPPPSAFGRTEDEVLRQLETAAFGLEADDPADLTRYLWTESFATRRVDVEVNAATSVGTRAVIGARKIPLRLTCAYCALDGGGYRVALPRFGWWFILEDLSIAGRVVEQAIATSLLGEHPAWVFEYRHRGTEYVVEWSPDQLARRSTPAPGSVETPAPPVLEQVAEEWVGRAERKRLRAPVGTDAVFDALAPAFERDPLPSLLLVGPTGVGKTAFVQRLAHHLLDRRRGKKGEGRRQVSLWATSADHIIAGMIYLGMWQDRVLSLIDALSHEGNYLYVDRLSDLMAPQSDGASIAELMAPAVAAGEISVIAECDERELARCRQRNPSFVDELRIVRLHEMPAATLAPLLERRLAKLAPRLSLRPGALPRALAHLSAFRRDVVFPGKAFQFADWLARDQGDRPASLDPRDMSAAFSRYSGLPVELISDDVPMGADAIAQVLRKGVVGQSEACDAVARLVARFKAGLDDPQRPVATLLFVGPTGVGKTELAKQLAAFMFGSPDRLIRADMSEYMVAGSAQRLLASGPGITSLAESVRRQPLSVVLLDEIEKAHPEVFDLLLGVLGEGRLTDVTGRLVDFRMTVIAMTSNLGARTTARPGFGDRRGGDYAAAVRNHFRPEFVGRLDHVLAFSPLGPDSIQTIVDLEIAKVAGRVGLERRHLTLRLTDAARTALAAAGHDPHLGARPLKRLIEDRIVAPLAVRLAAEPTLANAEIVIAGRDETGDADLRV